MRRHTSPVKTTLIVTTYNRKDALELVILSALHQSVLPHEIIVADDGSGAETADLVNSFALHAPIPILHCWHPDNGFRLAAIRNRAIAMSSYEYVIMIDGDIVLHKHFVRSHLQHAKQGYFLQGSRVLLLEATTLEAISKKRIRFNFFISNIRSRLNALYWPLLSSTISYVNTNLNKIRGCNMSFWRRDAYRVNGFNEDFLGWGLEDTDFAARMIHNGIQCLKMKLEGFGFHLYHPERPRLMLKNNEAILKSVLENKSTQCFNGLNKYRAIVKY